MQLSIITVTWNSQDCIEKQINSVKNFAKDLEYEQIIIDNNSGDKTTEVVQGISGVNLIKNKSNVGFAKANNQGLKIAQGQFVLFLNPDMELTDKTYLGRMVEYMKSDPSIGLMSCQLVNQAGKANKYDGPRRFIRVVDVLIMLLKLHHFFPILLNKYYYQDIDFTKLQEVETVRGSFMLVRKEILDKLGWAFDERYFIWMEDVDLCREVRNMGYKIVYNPNSQCIDLLGRSFSQEKLVKRQKMFYQSVIKYFRKWGI